MPDLTDWRRGFDFCQTQVISGKRARYKTLAETIYGKDQGVFDDLVWLSPKQTVFKTFSLALA
jgi:hypothetical protein